MSRAAKTLTVWSIHLGVLSATLVVAPNALLGLFGFPPTQEVWIRLVGMFLVFFAYLSIVSARAENAQYMMWSVHIRASVILFFGAFVALGLTEPILIAFVVVDLAAALWTRSALARDAAERAPHPAS